jgi:hypothetical protein
MDMRFFSNENAGMQTKAFHVEQCANRLWTMLLRRFGAWRLLLMPTTLGNPFARLVY